MPVYPGAHKSPYHSLAHCKSVPIVRSTNGTEVFRQVGCEQLHPQVVVQSASLANRGLGDRIRRKGIAAICLRVLETDRARAKRAERKKKNDLRLLADKISVYGNSVHRRYPTGDVIVSERDLAEQLRKRPDSVIIALNLLLNEHKAQKAPLSGYWKLKA
jgi:hypothetical protein